MNITKRRRTWFSLSGVLLILSILLILTLNLNLGLDFTGGARWDLNFKEGTDVNSEKLKSFFKERKELSKEAKIQESEEGTYLVTIEDLRDEEIQKISADLKKAVGDFEESSYRKVDATIGSSFKKKAFQALLAALAGIIIFVAYSFRKIPESIGPWRFGAVAIIALFHDIIILLGVFAVLGYITGAELDLPFITALLATLGFSVNDTIVILDRIRENIRSQKPHETFEDTIEKSVQQTLLRSINTSISTVLPLLGLLVFGASAIFYFVLALAVGILIGTYSSIFLAAPLLAEWKHIADKRA